MILGIDPGTSCGWAVLTMDGSRVDSGTWDLRHGAHEGAGMRYLRLRYLLTAVLGAHAVEVVAVELVRRHRGTTAAHVYGGLVATVRSECERLHVPYTGVEVGKVKRAATGSGAATKAAMVAAAAERWGHEPGTDDEADALWIAHTALEELRGP